MRQGQNTVLSAVMVFLAVILLLQLWLFVGALEAYAEGGQIGLQAAAVSAICVLAASWLTSLLK